MRALRFLPMLLAVAVQAQMPSTYEAVVTRKAGPPVTERIVAADATGLSLSAADGAGVIKLPYDQIESVRFVPPAGWDEITRLITAGRLAEVEPRMQPIAARFVPMTAAKGGNASKYIFAYVDVLRSQGKYRAAIDFLDKFPFPAEAPVVDRARRLIVKAYCLAMTGKVDEAEKMLNQVQAPDGRSNLFTIYQLARSRVYAQRRDWIASLDDISRIIAVKRLGSESYDEALYQSAEAYEALHRALAEQKQAVEKDDRLRRQMQQDRLDAVARFEVLKGEPLQITAVWDSDIDCVKSANSARLQLCRVYPASPWAVKAREKLSDEAKKELAGEAAREDSPANTGTPKPEEKPPRDRTGKNAKAADADGEVLQLDESTREKDEP